MKTHPALIHKLLKYPSIRCIRCQQQQAAVVESKKTFCAALFLYRQLCNKELGSSACCNTAGLENK